MKILMIYSSRTGNTEKICRAAAEELPKCDIYKVEEAPAPESYDLICLGYWVDKGMPDAKAREYLKDISNKKVVLFGTLGAWPDSDHAKECIAKSKAMLDGRGNTVLGSFICQGKVDPKIVEMIQKMPNPVHIMDEERKARLAEAAKHPDEKDFANAKEFIRSIYASLKG